MRILWSANAIWAPTGYGIQGRSLLPRLKRLGHEVANHAWYGLQGGMMQAADITVYPAAFDPFGTDIIGAWVKDFKADLVLSLLDIWVLPEDYAQRCRPARWAAWFPVDSQPVPELVVKRSKACDYPVTYSHFGQQEAQRAGLSTRYIPHGIETLIFRPGDRAAARKRLGVREEAYLVSMVAANKGVPSRKAFPENFLAFAAFRERHPEAVLYVHALAGTASNGVDLIRLGRACGIPDDALLFVNQPNYIKGLPQQYLAWVYQASDVLLAASQSEGFGIPIVEAQACGCPVITTDCTSMPELTCNGIATAPAQPFWTGLDAWAAVPSVASIGEALEAIYARPPEEKRQAAAAGIDFVQERYDWDVCVRTFWEPFLAEVEADLAHDVQRDA